MWGEMFKVQKLQLHKSMKLVLFLILTLLCSTIGRLLSDNMILTSVFFGSGYFLILLISMATGTALHESSHFLVLQELGFEINDSIGAFESILGVDNVMLTPIPNALLLGSIGLGYASWRLRKQKEV